MMLTMSATKISAKSVTLLSSFDVRRLLIERAFGKEIKIVQVHENNMVLDRKVFVRYKPICQCMLR